MMVVKHGHLLQMEKTLVKSCVQYVPNTAGKEVFAVGKTGISYSNNGGFNWKQVSKDSYYTIQFVDRNNAWLAGNNKIGKLILP